ncbi:xin actin-binding repeat-containing protein 2 isoform X2 [Oryzias latipes]|nr:xin actin-binding repeat-containing protein 2 isoform X2 [Oryzias latipes]
MYQAAVSSKESSASSSAVMMDESEACSLPGGLASVKKQFENQEFASSSSQSSVTQFHVQKRSVQEISSSSEVMMRSSARQEVIHDQRVHHNNVTTSYGNHHNETVTLVGGDDLPKVSTQALKEQYEKTIEEAAPAKEIKVDLDFNQFQWTPVNQSSKSSTSYDTSSAAVRMETASSASSMHNEATDPFSLPSSHLQVKTGESRSQSQESASRESHTGSTEQYFKHKNMAELKRLYKHIHPEVRKNLEEDLISQLSEVEKVALDSKEMSEVQQTRFRFENDGDDSSECSSPDNESVEWDEILKGEVQSRRWMFENKPLDTIKDDSLDEIEERNIAQQEIIAGKDVRHTAWMFETQPIDALGTEASETQDQSEKQNDLARGDVRTATWLFETQPLDYLNKIYQEDEQDSDATNDITGGDVKTARYLFETQHLDSLGKSETIEESSFLSLKSELEEIKGDVTTTTRMFETFPMCVIRGDSGEMLEITTIRREETEKGDVRTSRWMFETQPLDMINKDPAMVKLICGISQEETTQGGVNRGRWLFETKTLDSIKDEEWESSMSQRKDIIGADVRKRCLVFETQPMDTLKDNTNARPLPSEEIVGGDVKSAKHLFETVPMENLKELLQVGKLTKTVASEEEKGDVRHQKWVFESQPLESIREERKEITRTVNIQAQDKGDVTNYKERFETMDLSKCERTEKIQVEGVTSGSVKSNKDLFESTPLYAIQDSSGYYHEVRTVRREEIVKGDIHSCRWMFETRPIDQFDESISKFQIIKGISKQEIESGDVKTAKWLFETQPLDAIKYFSNAEVKEQKTKEEIEKGDVKTCRWLFETQPMDVLYEKVDRSETDVKEVHKGDVKTCTWLFETQMLDNIRDHSDMENILKTCTVKQQDIQGKDVGLARILFETENLENITGEESGSFRRVTEIDIQSGDVSRMKCIFENRSSDIMSSTSEETMQRLKTQQAEDIQKGNVVNCTWMFENKPIDAICDAKERETRTVIDVQGGNVDKGRFIFETYSLDQIKDESSEANISQLTGVFRNDMEKGDVKNYKMMFETQPLYAICDKEGHYHEVTTVTKEEIMRGDVVGARWLFETKPLDSIRDTEEVYVIKAVTEEGINKGDVNSARWRFETQPLDEITEEIKVKSKTVADIQGGDVKTNKQRFETDETSQKYVRTVSVSEIQRGDVRSATWMFETRTIDEIRGDGVEYDGMEKVKKEEVMKGDVKQSVWLFEKHPLDSIRESEDSETAVSKEEVLRGDVKTTTWLFETTQLHQFNESSVEKTEIIGKSIKETLEELYSQKMVESQGVLIEADEIGDIRMAKYKLLNQEAPQIQKEDIIRGDLSNIMMNLLNRRETSERGITIDKEERGDINTTVKQLLSQERGINVEKEAIIRGDIQEAMTNLLRTEGSSKRGILIQEDEKGDVKMTIYSLLNKGEKASMEKEDIIQGNVSKTLHRLLSNSGEEESKKIRVGEIERGNVSFYTTCIESGALDYLKQFQSESSEEHEEVQKEHIIGGNVEETKMLLRKNQQQVERTVAEDDIVPVDVNSIVQVFMTEPSVTYKNVETKDIVKGDLSAAMDSLNQAITQKVVIEKEEVVKGNIPTTLKSLEEAQHQAKEMEKPEIIRGDIRGALESLEKSASVKTEATVEDLVPGDVKGTLRSLQEAKQAVKEMEKAEIIKGDIHTAMQSLHEASSEKKTFQHQVSEQGDVKGTIQLLLEPATSPRMQRRGSTEGDVKTSIKSLYEGQDAAQVEKEEVVRGDVQGAIKSLMQRKQYTSKKRTHAPKKAKEAIKKQPTAKQTEPECTHEAEGVAVTSAPAVKNLTQSGDVCMQRHHDSKSLKTQVITQEEHVVAVVKTDNPAGACHQAGMKVQPPQKTPAPKPFMIKTKQRSNPDQTETKSADVIKQEQSASQWSNSNVQMSQMTTIKQVQTAVTEETVTQKQNHTSQKKSGALIEKQNPKSDRKNINKGAIKNVKAEIHFPPPPPTSPPPLSESDLSLPPPPSPVMESPLPPPSITRQDSDLPPPPPPPMEFFPPPPPDFLPPPPSPQELDALPQPPPARPFGKPLFKVHKQPEPPKQPAPVKPKWQKKAPPPPSSQVFPLETASSIEHKEESKVETQQTAVTSGETKSAPTKIPSNPSPQPPRKVFVPPIKLPPPAEPAAAPTAKPYARKFKTPLMLAEEKYRQQKLEKEAETEMSRVSTPTSPSVSISAATANLSAAAKAKEDEALHVNKGEFTEKTPSQTPMSRPTTLAVNKRAAAASATTTLDKKLVSVKPPCEKVLSSTANQTASVIQSHHEASETQTSSIAVTSSVVEQQHFIKKSTGKSVEASATSVRENFPRGSEDVKIAPQEGKTGASQATKIPKVSPSFKVKTFKAPMEKKEEQKETVKSDMSQRVSVESKQLTSAKTEVTAKEKRSEDVKKAEADARTKTTKQAQKTEAEVKLSPSVTVPLPKLSKTTAAHQGQALVSASHSQQSVKAEHIQRHEEVVVTERVVRRQEIVQQQQTKLQAAEVNRTQIKAGKSKAETKEVSVLITTDQRDAKLEENADLEKSDTLQKLLAQMKEFEGQPSRLDSNTVREVVGGVPDWVMSTDEKKNISEIAKQQSKKKLKEMLAYVRTIIQAKLTLLEKNLKKEEPPPSVPPKPDKRVLSVAASQVSAVQETQNKVVEEKKSLAESRVRHGVSQAAERRVSSPLASIRTPSPTFISIESRRVDSPLRVTPSPPPYRSAGTPPPPPRKSFTPTLSRTTMSPTLNRSEKLMKVSTSKLSRGMTPPPPPPMPEVVQREQPSPLSDREATLERSEQELVDVAEMVDSMTTVKDKKSFFEEAQRAEVNKTYFRKDPIEIPERLGPDAEEGPEAVTLDLLKEDLPKVDLSKLVNRFESPQPKIYSRKEPIVIAERLGSDTEDAEPEVQTPKTEEIPTLNVKAIKNVFETGEHSSQAAQELREQIERREQDSVYSEGSHSRSASVAEQFSNVDNLGNLTRSEMDSEKPSSRGNPPSYADVVRGRVLTVDVPPEASTEELLRSFQQSWAESQGVFQNLGFRVTEQRSSQVVTHQQETFVSENSSTRVRTVQGVPEAGVPHGVSDGRQTKLP